jgi:hypothetical protein
MTFGSPRETLRVRVTSPQGKRAKPIANCRLNLQLKSTAKLQRGTSPRIVRVRS